VRRSPPLAAGEALVAVQLAGVEFERLWHAASPAIIHSKTTPPALLLELRETGHFERSRRTCVVLASIQHGCMARLQALFVNDSLCKQPLEATAIYVLGELLQPGPAYVFGVFAAFDLRNTFQNIPPNLFFLLWREISQQLFTRIFGYVDHFNLLVIHSPVS
jgi:hypothetical protein